MATFGRKKKFVQCDSALVNNKSNICIVYNHVLIMNWSWPIHRDGSSQKRLRNLASTIKCISYITNRPKQHRKTRQKMGGNDLTHP